MEDGDLTLGCDAPPIPGVFGRFAAVPAGEGVVGSDRRVRAWDGTDYAEYPANGPPRAVRFSRPFLLARAPVTVAAFRETCPEVFAADALVFTLPEGGEVRDPWPLLPFSDVNLRDDHPVVGVTWAEAVSFCERLRQRYGVAARLPAEEEWEYAARAGARTVYAWGDDPRGSLRFAWTKQNSGMRVQPVGQLAPNAWGLHDMAGNVWEWCADEFRGGRGDGLQRAIRGGASFNEATAVRASHRWGQAPNQRNAFLGFRVVMDLPNRPADTRR